jgi:hypothetical protein
MAAGNPVRATRSGEIYMDVGTLEGYRAAQDFLRTVGRNQSLISESKEAA